MSREKKDFFPPKACEGAAAISRFAGERKKTRRELGKLLNIISHLTAISLRRMCGYASVTPFETTRISAILEQNSFAAGAVCVRAVAVDELPRICLNSAKCLRQVLIAFSVELIN